MGRRRLALLTSRLPGCLADAENVADGGGMILGNMDLSYLGVQAIWSNDLGEEEPRLVRPWPVDGACKPNMSY